MFNMGIAIPLDDDKKFVEFLQDEFQCRLSLPEVFGTVFDMKSEKKEQSENKGEADGYDEEYSEESIRCEECNKILKSMTCYKRHWAMVHKIKELSFNCNQCDFMAPSEFKLKQHLKKVHEPKNDSHLCNDCGKSFSGNKQLGRHIREVHHGIALNCDQCSFQTKRPRELRRHMENKHGNGDNEGDKQEKPDIFCEFCGFSCKYRQSLIDHMERLHLQNEYKCDMEGCDYVTKQKRKLAEHKTRHGEELICPICGKTFSTSKAWAKHKRETHKPKTERKCEYCDYTTISQKMYIKHLKWRHSEFSDKRYSNSKNFNWAENREKWKVWKNFNNKYSKN